MAAKSVDKQSRRDKGAALAALGAAYAVARHRWQVVSADGETVYEVRTEGAGKDMRPAACTCEDHKRRACECKHMHAVTIQAAACRKTRAAGREGALLSLHARTVERLGSAGGWQFDALRCLLNTVANELADVADVARERLERVPA